MGSDSGNHGRYYRGSGDGERRRVLRTRFKLASKKENLELLAKYLQLLTDRKEVQIVEKTVDQFRQPSKCSL
jgi:hypothetical protein